VSKGLRLAQSVSSRYKHNNYRKHETEKRRSCDVIQESARTTVSQKNTVARMTGHFNCVLINFHSQTPEAWRASCKSGSRSREAGRQFFIRLQMDCDLGVSRFLRNSCHRQKKSAAPARYSARRATSLELTLGGKSVEPTVRVISFRAVLRRRGLVWAPGNFLRLIA
jgi:hypothetical protein